MPIVAQGGTVDPPLRALVRNGAGQPSDATGLLVRIKDLDGDIVAGPWLEPDIVHAGLGDYTYAWTVPLLFAMGSYYAEWVGIVGGASVTGTDPIEVVLAGSIGPGALDILQLPGDYDAIRAMLGVTEIDVEDSIIDLPSYGPYIEARVKELVPDWSTVMADPVTSLFLRAAVRYGVAAELAESYVKGGTVSLVHKEEPRRNWSEWARIFWTRYEEALARVATSGIPDDDYDLPTGKLTGPTRSRGTAPDWTGVYPPVWPETPA